MVAFLLFAAFWLGLAVYLSRTEPPAKTPWLRTAGVVGAVVAGVALVLLAFDS